MDLQMNEIEYYNYFKEHNLIIVNFRDVCTTYELYIILTAQMS